MARNVLAHAGNAKLMPTLLDDLRFGFRLLFNRPGFTVIAILTLALGISVTTAMFSILDTMYWKA